MEARNLESKLTARVFIRLDGYLGKKGLVFSQYYGTSQIKLSSDMFRTHVVT